MNWLRRLLSLGFGGVFVYAGALKLQDPSRFLIDIRSFDLVPDPYAAWIALLLPWVEVFGGLAVILGLWRRGGLFLLNLLLVAFFIAIAIAKSRGLNIHCGCFGGEDGASDYLELFVRDGVLLAVGIILHLMYRPKKYVYGGGQK